MDNKLKIINYLGKNYTNEYTMHELSKLIDIPYASFYRAIHEMNGVVNVKTLGKSKILKLNLYYPTLKSHLAIASNYEKEEFISQKNLIKKITLEIKTQDIVILFGSYAINEETTKSDIDLLIINKKGEKSVSFAKYELLFRKKINPIFITNNEFIKMIKDKEENLGKQVIKKHIILNNPELFWELTLNGIQ
jgi:predicted nucleotidyltransferase